MTDTPSAVLLLRLMSTGSNTNLWGGYINTALQTLEQAAKGYQTLAVTGDATISWTNYSTGNTGQCAHLKLTGTLTSAAALTFPTYQNWMSVYNNAGKTVTIKCSGGTGIAIPNGRRMLIRCDAVDYTGDVSTYTSESTVLTNNGDLVSYIQMSNAIAAITAGTTTNLLLTSATATQATYLQQATTALGSGAISLSYSKVNGGTSSEQILITGSVGSLGLTAGAAQTTSFSAAVNTRYTLAKTGNLTITMPAAPAVGDVLWIEISGTAGLVTWGLNSLKAYGSTTNPSSAGEGIQVWSYSGASRGWIDL